MTGMDPRMAARRQAVQEGRARRSLGKLLWLLGFVMLVAAGWWLLRSPVFSVDTLELTGDVNSDAAGIVETEGAGPGTPLIEIDAQEVEAALEADPWVIDAVVRRDWPTGLVVSIEERTAVALVEAADGVFTVAADGVVVGGADVLDIPFPVLNLPERSVAELPADTVVTGALAFLGALDPHIAANAIASLGPEGLKLRVAGYEVRVGGPERPVEKAQALEAVLREAPEEGSVITVISPERPAVLAPGAAEAAGATQEADEEAEEGEG